MKKNVCICEKPQYFGNTCPVHKTVCEAWPEFAELMDPDESGDEEESWMPESRMGREDYERVIQFNRERALHHQLLAEGYRNRMEKRFGKS
jgi:hypothetical protein